MNLTPDIWLLEDGSKVYMYSVAQLEYMRNEKERKNAIRAARKTTNPYEPIVSAGYRKERHGNHA